MLAQWKGLLLQQGTQPAPPSANTGSERPPPLVCGLGIFNLNSSRLRDNDYTLLPFQRAPGY